MLLIANLHDIRCTSLSGSSSRLPSIATKQTMAMDFIYAEETVCWIDVGDTPAATQLKCASIPDLKTVTNIRTINVSLSLHREYRFKRRRAFVSTKLLTQKTAACYFDRIAVNSQ